jgi:hypothetical protein
VAVHSLYAHEKGRDARPLTFVRCWPTTLTASVTDGFRKITAIVNDPANDRCRMAQRRANDLRRRYAANNHGAANVGWRRFSTMYHRPLPQDCRNCQRFRQRPLPRGTTNDHRHLPRQSRESQRRGQRWTAQDFSDVLTITAAVPPQTRTTLQTTFFAGPTVSQRSIAQTHRKQSRHHQRCTTQVFNDAPTMVAARPPQCSTKCP